MYRYAQYYKNYYKNYYTICGTKSDIRKNYLGHNHYKQYTKKSFIDNLTVRNATNLIPGKHNSDSWLESKCLMPSFLLSVAMEFTLTL